MTTKKGTGIGIGKVSIENVTTKNITEMNGSIEKI